MGEGSGIFTEGSFGVNSPFYCVTEAVERGEGVREGGKEVASWSASSLGAWSTGRLLISL